MTVRVVNFGLYIKFSDFLFNIYMEIEDLKKDNSRKIFDFLVK